VLSLKIACNGNTLPRRPHAAGLFSPKKNYSSATNSLLARWRKRTRRLCKASYPGSNPGRASNACGQKKTAPALDRGRRAPCDRSDSSLQPNRLPRPLVPLPTSSSVIDPQRGHPNICISRYGRPFSWHRSVACPSPRRASTFGADSDKITAGWRPCEAFAMRIIMLAVLAAGAFWAYDSYEYEGRYSRELWRQVATDGQYFSDQVQRLINGALSGH
jgi:hypothetical protein